MQIIFKYIDIQKCYSW